MERLRRADLLLLLDVVRDIGAIRHVGAFPAGALGALGRVVPGDLLVYNEVDLGRRRSVAVLEPAEADFPGSTEALSHHADEHPLIAHFRQAGRLPLQPAGELPRRPASVPGHDLHGHVPARSLPA